MENIEYKFKNFDLTIDSSNIIGIIGKNGSGKTTLLDLIYQMDISSDGKIYINKNTIYDSVKTSSKKYRKEISYLRQNNEYNFFCKNILEDIKSIDKVNLEELKNLLKLFGIRENLLNKDYFELSSGQFQKISIIKVILKNSKILLFDDPTKNMDEKSALNLIKILKRKKREGKIIILASLDSDFLLKVSDKLIVLYDNNLYINDDIYEIFSNNVLLNKINIKMPKLINFKISAEITKKIKLVYRDNINDLVKDIYRNVK